MLVYKRVTLMRREPFKAYKHHQLAEFEGYYLFGFIRLYIKQVTDWK